MDDFTQMQVGRELMVATFFGKAARSWTTYMLDRVGSAIEAASMPAGTVLWREGDPAEHIVFLAEGRARACGTGRADWVYEGRWALGGADVTLRRARTRTMTLERDTVVFRLPAALLLDVLTSNVEICQAAIAGEAPGQLALWSRVGASSRVVPSVAPRPLDGLDTDRAAEPDDDTSLAGHLAFLSEVDVVRSASAQAVADLAQRVAVIDVGAHDVLHPDASAPPRLLFVRRGEIEVQGEDGRVAAAYGPGDAVALPVLLARPKGWTVRAARASRLLALDVDAWLDQMEVHPELALAALGTLTLERERLQDVLAAREGELVL